MFITLMLVCAAFGLFIILNWKYISDPSLLPHYNGNSIFEYQEDLAKFRHWGFFYPWNVLGFLIYLQSFMIAYLLIKKNLGLSLRNWVVIISSIILIFFLPEILKFLSVQLNFSVQRIISNIMMILIIINFFFSIWMIFLKPYRHCTKFLSITFFTAVMNIVFIFSFMELFFD